jgi:superfamily II DNA/RNA helicase
MRQPRKIQIDNPQEKHVNIKQVLFWADNAQHKRKLLDHWLRDTSINQAIVFASTQIECDGLANDLQQAGFDAVALHGALNQGLRNRRLMALRQGQVQVLVATDVAARGIDVPTITHVFNFGLPMKAEDYTHRIGRTGRAGRDGLAVTFAEFRDRRKIFDIEGYTKQPFKSEVIPGMEPQQRAPQSRPGGDFAGRGGRETPSRDRKYGPARSGGFTGAQPREERSFEQRRGGNEGYGRKTGFGDAGRRNEGFAARGNDGFAARGNDGFATRNHEGFAPRGDFAARAPAFGKPARPGNGGKVFVPRDIKKRPYKPAN